MQKNAKYSNRSNYLNRVMKPREENESLKMWPIINTKLSNELKNETLGLSNIFEE